jgi:type IV pilus assembly protein PilC
MPILFPNKRITQKDVLEFNRNMSLMLLSKLTLIQSFELYLTKIKNVKFYQILGSILKDIRSGRSLSKSMSKYPDLFSELYIASLKIAEETGEIDTILADYTIYQEKMLKLKKKIIEALRYPILVTIVAVGVVGFMVFFLIPTFESLFFNTKLTLPTLTYVIVSISYFIQSNILYISLTLCFIAVILWKAKDSEIIRYSFDSFLIKFPIISNLFKKNLLARFSFSMSILMQGKVPLVESLRIARKIARNKFFQEEISKTIKRIVKGEKFASNLKHSQIFDSTFIRLLTVGEESAELDKVFKLIGEYYQEEFDYQLESVTSLIEPVLILLIGTLVAVILIAMYLPMFEIINHFGI